MLMSMRTHIQLAVDGELLEKSNKLLLEVANPKLGTQRLHFGQLLSYYLSRCYYHSKNHSCLIGVLISLVV